MKPFPFLSSPRIQYIMPKLQNIKQKDVAELLARSLSKALRPSQVDAIATYLSALEAKLETYQRWEQDHASMLASEHLELKSSGDGTILVGFPGQHQVRVPTGLTLSDRAFAMDLILRILAERRASAPGERTVGSRGAPTQHELRVLAEAARKGREATKIPGKKRAASREELDAILSEIKL